MIEQRLTKLRVRIASAGLEALIVSQPQNRRYMSGFTGSAGVLVVTPERAILVTDFRYYEQVKAQAPAYELAKTETSAIKALAGVVGELGLTQVGFESDDLSVHAFEQWREAMGQVTWVPTTDMVEALRVVKDEDEIARIEEAVRIADEAMARLMARIHPGMTERQVAWDLEVDMRTHGAQALSFTTIVASGPNAALPHAVTTKRVIEAGDPIVIDMGCVYQGYCSDMTRSFCLGPASERYQQVWDTVLEAQLAAEAGIKPGMSGVEADAIARDIIYGAGYEGMFGHGLGHGVGLAIHETPRASYTSKDTLEAGMIVTVEPGIYLPGWGGVRTEDMAVLTEDGCRILTQSPKPISITN